MSPEGRAVYDVVDGKQRIETILMFANNRISVGSDFFDARIASKKFKELGETERRAFWNYVLPVEQLDFEPSDTDAVQEAFDRLNRNSRKLEAQELRHARYDGWLMKSVETECQDNIWAKNFGVVTPARSKRMKDAQFVSELLLVIIEKKQHDFDQLHLDNAYARYDDPDDEGIEFDSEEFTRRLSETKEFLLRMNTVGDCVRTAGATVGAFYSLWSLVALHKDRFPDPLRLGQNYQDFIALTNRLRANETGKSEDVLLSGQEKWLEPARNYVQAIQGAHTNLGPRETRLNALLQALCEP